MRVGVVGDIHGNYQDLQRALVRMGPLEALCFTGDGFREIARLRRETDLTIYGVMGNCDPYSDYPPEQLLQLDQHRIFLTHGHLYGVKRDLTRITLAGRERQAQLVVFGHTHQALNCESFGVKLFNPGALEQGRSFGPSSYGIIETTPVGLSLSHGQLS